MIATGNARSLQGNNESVPAMSANVSLGPLVVFAVLEIRVQLLAAECSGLYVTPDTVFTAHLSKLSSLSYVWLYIRLVSRLLLSLMSPDALHELGISQTTLHSFTPLQSNW